MFGSTRRRVLTQPAGVFQGCTRKQFAMNVTFRSPVVDPIHLSLTTGRSMMVTHEGTEVPEAFHADAIAKGAIPVSGGDKKMKMMVLERKLRIQEAVQFMASARNKGDLDWNGAINLKRLIERLGFQVYQDEADAALAEVIAEPAA
jgi:hypothetical protein